VFHVLVVLFWELHTLAVALDAMHAPYHHQLLHAQHAVLLDIFSIVLMPPAHHASEVLQIHKPILVVR